jgi:hypothetical protein
MAFIELRKAIKKKVTISKEVKPPLFGRVCDSCGLVFGMMDWCNDRHSPGQLKGTFDECAVGSDGKSLGNTFRADVCSFTCAQEIYDGGWVRMKRYKPFIRAKAQLVRVSLGLTRTLRTEAELVAAWERGEVES